MKFVHTEIEQTTNVKVSLEMDEYDIELLMAIFRADIRVPQVLARDGDLSAHDIDEEELKAFMSNIYGQLLSLQKSI